MDKNYIQTSLNIRFTDIILHLYIQNAYNKKNCCYNKFNCHNLSYITKFRRGIIIVIICFDKLVQSINKK